MRMYLSGSSEEAASGGRPRKGISVAPVLLVAVLPLLLLATEATGGKKAPDAGCESWREILYLSDEIFNFYLVAISACELLGNGGCRGSDWSTALWPKAAKGIDNADDCCKECLETKGCTR